MIYIHAENLGLLDQLVNALPLTDATAKDFSWRIRLSTEETSSDKDVTVVEMPQEMALSLFFWYMDKEARNDLKIHLYDLLDNDEMKDKVIKQLEWSVDRLTFDRRNPCFKQIIKKTEAYMAEEIEDHIEYGFAKELYALLDAKGFAKEVKA